MTSLFNLILFIEKITNLQDPVQEIQRLKLNPKQMLIKEIELEHRLLHPENTSHETLLKNKQHDRSSERGSEEFDK